jgi:DNA-binding transcriptional MerR regulator
MVDAARAGESRLNIGQVLDRLRPEFPGISLPKLRYLEAEGIVVPERTSTNYRKYSDADVERLRYALTLQRDRFWPLKRIKEHLEKLHESSESWELPAYDPLEPPVTLARAGLPRSDAFRADPSTLRFSRREFLAEADVSEDFLAQLEQYGLITPRPGSSPYDVDALAIARTVSELGGYGIEPRHLRSFKTAADREVGLVEQVVSPIGRSREDGAQGRAEEAMAQIAALSVKLHATMVKVGLRGLRSKG